MSMDKKPENLKLTPASEIRRIAQARQDGELVLLPSGITVKLRRPDLIPLLRANKIPSELLNTLADQASGKMPTDHASLVKNLDAVDTILKEAFIEPKIVDKDPQDNEILLTDLSDADRGFAFTYVQSGVKQAEFFRKDGTGEDTGHSSKEVSESKTE